MDTSDIVVIHGGCKDISPRQNQEKLTEEEIAKEIVSIGSCYQDKGVNKKLQKKFEYYEITIVSSWRTGI